MQRPPSSPGTKHPDHRLCGASPSAHAGERAWPGGPHARGGAAGGARLRGLAGPGLAHDHHDLVLADDLQQLVAHGVHGQVLPLLRQRLGLGELAGGLRARMGRVG